MRSAALLKFGILFITAFISLPGHAGGGFAGLQAGITDSQDMDKFGNTFKLTFGPNITSRLSMELGLMDTGKASYDDPHADFSEADDETPPTFSGSSHGSVSSSTATDSEQSYATYTGFASAHPQSFLITLRYRFPLTDDLDFFLKTGANVWWADYEIVEITAYQDGTQSRNIVKKGQTSAVDQISGGGFLWKVTSGMSIRAELETTALDSKEFERVRFQLVTMGLQYDF